MAHFEIRALPPLELPPTVVEKVILAPADDPTVVFKVELPPVKVTAPVMPIEEPAVVKLAARETGPVMPMAPSPTLEPVVLIAPPIVIAVGPT